MTGFADDSLISDFVVETREHLDAIEPDLLAMEQEGATVSQEIVNRVFRAIHSTKGGAGFLSFSKLKLLSHAMESVLMLVRDGEMLVSAELMDVLLAGVDKLRAMVDDIQASEQVEIEEDLQRLNTILEQEGVNKDAQVTGQTMAAEAGEEEKGVRMFDLNAQEVRNALNRGMFIYEATVYIHRDLQDRGFTPLEFLDNVESLGICLEARFDLEGSADLEGCLEQDLAFTFLFATVLEEDLVAAGLELPEEQIVALDRDKLKEKLFGTEKPEAPEVPEAPAAEAPPLEEGEVKAEVSKGGGGGGRDLAGAGGPAYAPDEYGGGTCAGAESTLAVFGGAFERDSRVAGYSPECGPGDDRAARGDHADPDATGGDGVWAVHPGGTGYGPEAGERDSVGC